MKLAIIGYGNMGREIERIALERKHTIELTIDVDSKDELTPENLVRADVAIEFTTPGSVISNLYACFESGIPVVTGTTGWHNQREEVFQKCNSMNASLFYASNFSIGVNLFFEINKITAQLLDKFNQYDVSISETHHTRKLDAPSGTAVSLAEILTEKLSKKQGWSLDSPGENEIGITAIRQGDVAGIHSVKFESAEDSIELSHSAFSRKGFAKGAVAAAEFIVDKKGIFTMSDLLGF